MAKWIISLETTRQIKILLVEDNPGDARLVAEALRESNRSTFVIEKTKSLTSALKILRDNTYDAILLDLSLPDSFGSNTVEKVNGCCPDTPIIVLTGARDEATAMKVVEKGAQDYLVKGEAPTALLVRTIHYAIYRKQTELKLTQTIGALREALDKVKLLSGIIPICSYCKKIRNDQGYWDKLEEFISNHSDAVFSHGICDKCMEENSI